MTSISVTTTLSRRSLIRGAGGLASVATIGTVAPLAVYGQSSVSVPIRQDVVEFAKDAGSPMRKHTLTSVRWPAQTLSRFTSAGGF
jgi:hypothetical protein